MNEFAFEIKHTIIPRKVYLVGAEEDTLVAKRVTANEIESHSRVSHPQIPGIKGFGTIQRGKHEFKQPYAIFPYLDVEDLFDFIETPQEDKYTSIMSLDEALRFGASASKPLGHINNQGIQHKDVSLANLLWDEVTAYVIDLGESHRMDLGEKMSTEKCSWVYGSPETILKDSVSGTTDVYSLGVILLHMLSNRRDNWPSPGERFKEIMKPENRDNFADDLYAQAESVSSWQRYVTFRFITSGHKLARPPELQQSPTHLKLIQAMVEFDPSNRPTMGEVQKGFYN